MMIQYLKTNLLHLLLAVICLLLFFKVALIIHKLGPFLPFKLPFLVITLIIMRAINDDKVMIMITITIIIIIIIHKI